MKVHHEERNGKVYAYTCTSRRIPGKKNPVCKKEYIGTVDPRTGEIIPLNGQNRRVSLSDGVTVRNYGDAAVVLAVAERTGIVEDLRACFGDAAESILMVALGQAMRPTPSSNIHNTIAESQLPEMLGLDRSPVSPEWVRSVINGLEEKECMEFFVRRSVHAEGGLLAYGTFATQEEPGGSRTRFLRPSYRNSCVLIMVDRNGEPVGFNHIKGPFHDTVRLREVLDLIRDYGVEFTFVSDIDMSPHLDIGEFLGDGIDFMMPFDGSSEQYRVLFDDYADILSPKYSMDYHGNRYQMKKGTTGYSSTVNRTHGLVPESDAHHGSCERRLKTYVTFDPSVRSKVMDVVRSDLESIKAQVDGTVTDDPESLLAEVAGDFRQLLNIRTRADGSIEVTRNRKEIDRLRKSAGGIMVLATSADWEEVMDTRFARLDLLSTLGSIFRNPGWPMEHVVKGTNVSGMMFVDYLVMIIYHRILKTLRTNGRKDLSVSEALFLASSYKVVSDRGKAVMSSRDRRAGHVMRLLGVDDGYDPTSPRDPMFGPRVARSDTG